MSDKDPKDRHDIESDVIDSLLDAIDGWDLESELSGEAAEKRAKEAAAKEAAAAAPQPEPAAPDQGFGEDDDIAVVDDLDMDFGMDGEYDVEFDDDVSEDSRTSTPLYEPRLDFEEDDDESTRMVDLRADDRYHKLVRSSREEEEERAATDDAPTPIPAEMPSLDDSRPTPIPEPAAATESPLEDPFESPVPTEPVVPSVAIALDSSTPPPTPVPVGDSEDVPTPVPEASPSPAEAIEPESRQETSDTYRGEPVAPETEDIAIDEPVRSKPAAMRGRVEPPTRVEQGFARRPQAAVRSGMAVVHMGEEDLPGGLIGLLDGMLPTEPTELPASGDALPPSDELLDRLEAFDAGADAVEPMAFSPEVLAGQCEAAAEGSSDIAKAAGHLCDAARIRERRLGDHSRARELYVLALQLEPELVPAISGRRRETMRSGLWDDLPTELEAELAAGIGDEERLELLLLKAEYCLSRAKDPGRAVDVYNDLTELAAGDVRVAALRAEIAAIELDDGELGVQAVKLADQLTDAETGAALRAMAARASEAVGDHEAAREQFEAAAKLDTTSPAGMAGLARTRALTGEHLGEAETLVDLGAMFGGGAATAAFNRRAAALRLAHGEPAKAVELLSEPQDRLEWATALAAAYGQGDTEAASSALEALAASAEDRALRASYLAEAVTLGSGQTPQWVVDQLESCMRAGPNATATAVRAELARQGLDVDSLPAVDAQAGGSAFRQALAHDKQGQSDKAHELFASMASGSSRTDAELALGVLAAASQEWSVVAELAKRAGESPASPQWQAGALLAAGRLSELALGDVAAGQALYARALELAPGLLPAVQGLRRTAPDGAACVEAAQQLADDTPNRLAAAALLVDAARSAELDAADDGAAALKAYRAALESEPSAIPAVLGAERILRDNEGIDELLDLWRQASGTVADGLAAFNHARAARVLTARDDRQEAGEALAQAIEGRPDDVTLAAALGRLSRSQAAVDRLEQIAPSLPERAALAALLRASELHEENDPENALRCAREALALDAAHAGAARAVKRLSLLLGQEEQLELELEARIDETEDRQLKGALFEEWIGLAAARGDLAEETRRRAALIETESDHISSLFWLAGRYLSDQQWEELSKIHGLLATAVTDDADAAAFAAMSIRMASVVSDRPYGELETAKQAVARQPQQLRALLDLYFSARVARDAESTHDAAAGLAKVLGVPRCRSVFELRAADALGELSRGPEALEAVRRAAEGDGVHPLAAWRRSHLAEEQEIWGEAAEAAEVSAGIALDINHKTQEYLRAAKLWLGNADDKARALTALRAATEADPTCEEAFELANQAMDGGTDPKLALEMIAQRLAGERTPEETAELAKQGATLAFDLGDRERGKELLKTVLSADEGDIEALQQLIDAYMEDGDWADAAQSLVQLSRLIDDPDDSLEVYFKLGVIHQDKLPDSRRSIPSFQKVLSFDPKHLETLRRLSVLLGEAQEWKAAAETTQTLAETETEPDLRREALLRLSHAHESGLGDSWRAEQALDEARRIDPTDLSVVEAFAAFYTRQGAQPALMVHLDRAAADFRRILETAPCDMSSYHALFDVFSLRQAEDNARLAATVLDSFGVATDKEKALLTRLGGSDWVPGQAVADVRIDEDFCPPAITPSLRALFQRIGDALSRLHPQDARKHGLGRGQKQGVGNPVVDLTKAMCPWYGLRDVDVYFHPSEPNFSSVLASSPPALVFGQAILDRASEGELRFVIGRGLALLQRKLTLLQQLPHDRLALILPAIVKTVYPNYEAEDVDEAALATMTRDVGKVLPKRVRQDLGPFALECVGEVKVAAPELSSQAVHFADRAGLLAAGGLVPALLALERLTGQRSQRTSATGELECPADDPRAGALLQFFVSKAHSAVREKLGLTSIM